VHRRSFLGASGAIVGAHLLGRPAVAQQASVKGAGAGFPAQVLAAWGEAAKGPAGVRIGYDAAGTNDGVAKVVNGEVDFAMTAMPMSAGRLRNLRLVQFPAMLGAVVFTVNLPGVAVDQLKLTGDTVADLYLGRIKRWNDPKLAEHNPGLGLPDLAVAPVYRSDISGTTLLATTFLSRASETWRDGGPRAGSVVLWPVGKGGHMNEGVAEAVRATPGAIGYVTNAFAVSKRLPAAQLRNHSGAFAKPDAAALRAAAEAANWGARGFAVDAVDLDGPAVWPIVGPGFAFVPVEPLAERVEGVRGALKFFDWSLKNGGEIAARGGNAPLPDAVAKAVREAWGAVRGADGAPLWKA
jgi:phosphate transport system substrate-binding protein